MTPVLTKRAAALPPLPPARPPKKRKEADGTPPPTTDDAPTVSSDATAVLQHALRFQADRRSHANAAVSELMRRATAAGPGHRRHWRLVAKEVDLAGGFGGTAAACFRLMTKRASKLPVPCAHPTFEALVPAWTAACLAVLGAAAMARMRWKPAGARYLTAVAESTELRSAMVRRGGGVDLALVVFAGPGTRPAPEAGPVGMPALANPELVGVGGTCERTEAPDVLRRLRAAAPGTFVWFDPDPQTGVLRRFVGAQMVAGALGGEV